MSIRILHTSDLHALAPLPADQRLVVDRLLDDVKRKSAETAIDLIVFSGDLGATGQTVEFEVGRRKLLDRLSALTGLGPDRVVLVPGNHDVDKDAIEEIYEDGLRSRLTSHEKLVETLSNDRHVSQALGRMDSWIAFTDAFYGASDRQRFAPGAWTRRLDIRGTTVGIASLNSAWRSTGIGEQERGTLLVGDLQARTAVDQIIDCDIRLIVVHHPLEWLAEFDRKEVRREFERAGAIVMTGHEHESDSMHLVSGMGAANHSRAGCLYFGFGYPNAYSLIDLELLTEKTVVTVRTWQPSREQFDAGVDAANGGVFVLPLAHRSEDIVTVPHANISAALVDLIRRTSVVADRLPEKPASSLAELLIAPRFYPAPFPELAAATVERGVMHVDRVDPMKALGENRVVVLIGDRESGVTAGLAWLLERRHLADPSLPALYIRFDTRQGKRVIEDDIHAAAAKVGWRVDRGTKVPPALIGIDDVERGSDRAIERLVAHIVDHPEHRYVIGCHSDSKRDVLGALVEAGLSPTALYLGPLNRPSEVQQLVRKIVRTPSKALADKVSAVLSAGRLPRTPFLMAALTVVLNAGDLQALDPTAVIDRYIDLMLGRTDIIYHGKFDYRRLIHALEYLAGQFTIAGITVAPRRDIETWLRSYLDRLGDQRTSPDRLIGDFVSRGVLIDLDGDVSFRHPALQHVLAAKWMREPDQADFGETVRKDVVKHREVVRHASALMRNDKELLVAVFEQVDQIVKSLTKPSGGARIDSLIELGETGDVDPSELGEKIDATAPKSSAAAEAELDDLYERLGTLSAARSEAPTEPVGAAHVGTAVGLLSYVVASSELVTDIELRAVILKAAIVGWGQTAVEILKEEELSGMLSKLLRQTLLKEATDQAAAEVLERVLRVSLMIGLLAGASAALGNRQIEPALTSVLRDDAFMAGAINALITVWLASQIKIAGWVAELKKLRANHKKHAFIRELTLNIALSALHSPATSEADAEALEKFVQEIYAEAAKGGVKARQMAMSKVQTRLRQLRTQAKLANASSDILALGAADDDDESFGGVH